MHKLNIFFGLPTCLHSCNALLKWVARRKVGVTGSISMASRLCSASCPFFIGDPTEVLTLLLIAALTSEWILAWFAFKWANRLDVLPFLANTRQRQLRHTTLPSSMGRPSTPRSKPKYSHTTLFVPILGTSSESDMSNNMWSQSRLDYWLSLVQRCSCCQSTCTCQTIFNVLR